MQEFTQELVHEQDPEAPRLLDDATAHDVIEQVKRMCSHEGGLSVSVQSWGSRGQRWGRNRATLTSDKRDVMVSIRRELRGASKDVTLNQIDTASLRSALDWVNYYVDLNRTNAQPPLELEEPRFATKGKSVWSDETFNRGAQENGEIVKTLTQRAEERGLLSAGYIQTSGARIVFYTRDIYGRESMRDGRAAEAQCSVTVRHPQGTGSGWAGNSSFDLPRIDMARIAELAFEKCTKSLDPVRIEPGRYQTILEPQAVSALAGHLFGAMRYRGLAEHRGPSSNHPFFLDYDRALGIGRSKLGLRIVDSRLNMYHDPEDPISGTHPGEGMDKVHFITDGVLTSLAYPAGYAIAGLGQQNFDSIRSSFVLSGGQTSIDEMVSTTERGLLVTRFSGTQLINGRSLLMTGVTRDGLWLIENGKITKAVRNFRFTESPLFAFNNVVDLGIPTPVFSPNRQNRFLFSGGFQDAVTSIVVPPMKVNDFSFTSTIDAI